MKLLIAEDAHTVAQIVAFGARLTWPDCEVIVAPDGTEALRKFHEESPDLVILDISMPPPDGFAVCRQIRERSEVPIMMLTVRDSTLDKIRALDTGADDYLTKPFDHLELLARMRALLRRAGKAGSMSAQGLTVGPVTLDPDRHEANVNGRTVELTSTEYRLLDLLARNAGTVLPYRVILEKVWGPEYANEDHYVKVFVRRLRSKLGDDARHPRFIQTEWNIGYRFTPHAS